MDSITISEIYLTWLKKSPENIATLNRVIEIKNYKFFFQEILITQKVAKLQNVLTKDAHCDIKKCRDGEQYRYQAKCLYKHWKCVASYIERLFEDNEDKITHILPEIYIFGIQMANTNEENAEEKRFS